MDLVTLALAKKLASSGGGSGAGIPGEDGVGDIPKESTIKSYIDSAVGAGRTDVDSQIDEALSQAKAYTDTVLTIIKF